MFLNLILASTSPRRADLLRQSGLSFVVVPPPVKEKLPEKGLDPGVIATSLACDKARSVAAGLNGGFVLAADTLVVCRGNILGKPADPEDARRMLGLLQGERHTVLTGLALLDVSLDRLETGLANTDVWIKGLSDEEIAGYVATGEPFDKAGGYAIQGRAALFVPRIEGCYFNVVGLPLSLLDDLIKRAGLTRLFRKDGDHAK